MKKMHFVSPGRCGTKRIYEILNEKLGDEYIVKHQMRFSRLANIIGNLMFYIGESEIIKKVLYTYITRPYLSKKFICSDPLTAMIIPSEFVISKDVCIIKLTRDKEEFATSFYNYSKSRILSFIAHNFIPLWQLFIWPMENLINKNIKYKYEKIMVRKSRWFDKKYSQNPNYKIIDYKKLFTGDMLEKTVNEFFNTSIKITDKELAHKTNCSVNCRDLQ